MKIPLLLVSLLPCFLFAQETDGTEFSANVGVTFTSGNSESEQLNLGFDARNVSETTEISAKAFYNYGRSEEVQNGETVEVANLDKGKFETKVNRVLSAKNFASFSFAAEQDNISGIDYRVTTGPGLGAYLRRDDTMTLSVEGGVVWVFEEVDTVSDDYVALRIFQSMTWNISEGAKLSQEVEVVGDVSEPDRYFINAKLIAEASLTARLGLRAEIRDTYNNQPGSGKEKNDITVLSGITVNW
jgi:putative salt-induced outer membrane protein YdiY